MLYHFEKINLPGLVRYENVRALIGMAADKAGLDMHVGDKLVPEPYRAKMRELRISNNHDKSFQRIWITSQNGAYLTLTFELPRTRENKINYFTFERARFLAKKKQQAFWDSFNRQLSDFVMNS